MDTRVLLRLISEKRNFNTKSQGCVDQTDEGIKLGDQAVELQHYFVASKIQVQSEIRG